MTMPLEKVSCFSLSRGGFDQDCLNLDAPGLLVAKNKRESLRPSDTKISKLFIKKNSWCTRGELTSLPFSFRLTKTRNFIYVDSGYQHCEFHFTEEFFQTQLGKEYSTQETYYKGFFKSIKATRKLVEQQFRMGTCWGQVTAIMIAYRNEKDHKKLVPKIDKTQVLFFQAMSYLRWHYKKETGRLKAKNEEVKKNHFDECRKKEIEVFQKLAEMTLISAAAFAPDRDLYGELTRIGREYKEVSVRITFPYKEEAHASCIFLGKKNAIYDSLFGLISYKTNEDLLTDLKSYCGRIQEYAQNNRRGTFLEVFQANS
jgi:hypothetical protein